jgi:CheY-like chemotaxis protein
MLNQFLSSHKAILLVDDNDAVRESLRAVLEFSRFDVKTAANVTEAIHLIDTEKFDIRSSTQSIVATISSPEQSQGCLNAEGIEIQVQELRIWGHRPYLDESS